jgi:hypothetical protein
MKQDNSPMLSQPPADNSPALGGTRAIRMCPIHKVRMARTLFDEHICLKCHEPTEKRRIVTQRRRLVSDPSWFHAGKLTPIRHIANVRAGRHPMGSPLSDDPDARCGNCHFFCRVEYYGGREIHLKCAKMRGEWTHGPATDIRRKWQACDQWQPQRISEVPAVTTTLEEVIELMTEKEGRRGSHQG